MTADSIAANNEFEQSEPQVAVNERRLDGFEPEMTVIVPPFSMQAFAWQAQ